MMNSIEELVNEVVSNVNDEWPTVLKIRYVYLSLGKRLKKYVEFFWGIFNKPEIEGMSVKDLKEIYEDDKTETKDDWNAVICRSAALILKMCYDKLGIESYLVKTSKYFEIPDTEKNEFKDDSFLMHHWFLAVKDQKNTYFLNLAADLPYIQNGFMTRHFALNIPQYRKDKNGNAVPTYEGEAINHTLLSESKIREIDNYLGYLNSYYKYESFGNPIREYVLQYNDVSFAIIKQYLRKNDWYYSIAEEKTIIYNTLVEFVGTNGRLINLNEESFSSISNDDFNIWMRRLCNIILSKILRMTGFKLDSNVKDPIYDYEGWLNDVSNIIKQYFASKYLEYPISSREVLINSDDNPFQVWYKKSKKVLSNEPLDEFYNPLALLSKVNSIVTLVKERRFEKNNFSILLHKIMFHFIDPDRIFNDDKYVSNRYIALKFSTMFSRILDCNEGPTSFNKLGYSEQSAIISELISDMFRELNFNNCQFEKYDIQYSPALNRIQYYPLKSREDGSYFILFNIIGKEKDSEYFFLYDLKKNEFKPVDILNIVSARSKFMIISKRLNDKIASLENVEVKKTSL